MQCSVRIVLKKTWHKTTEGCYAANVYRELQGAGKLECRDFKFMGIAFIPTIPVILKSPHFYFHCNICREFDLSVNIYLLPVACLALHFTTVIMLIRMEHMG